MKKSKTNKKDYAAKYAWIKYEDFDPLAKTD